MFIFKDFLLKIMSYLSLSKRDNKDQEFYSGRACGFEAEVAQVSPQN